MKLDAANEQKTLGVYRSKNRRLRMTDRVSLLIICVTIVFVVSITADCIKSRINAKKEEKELEFDLELRRHSVPCQTENSSTVKGVIVRSKEWMEDE